MSRKRGSSATRRKLVIAVVTGVATITVGVIGAATAGSAPSATKVNVQASEMKFKLSASNAKAGTVTFVVKNVGAVDHDFKLGGQKTAKIKPGKSVTITISVKKGKNAFLCTLPGHAAAGMKGVFTGK